jgi:hypothetical protein
VANFAHGGDRHPHRSLETFLLSFSKDVQEWLSGPYDDGVLFAGLYRDQMTVNMWSIHSIVLHARPNRSQSQQASMPGSVARWQHIGQLARISRNEVVTDSKRAQMAS